MPIDRRLEALATDRMTGITKASRDLGLGERTLRAAVSSGELPAYVFGRRQRLKLRDIRTWLERHRRR